MISLALRPIIFTFRVLGPIERKKPRRLIVIGAGCNTPAPASIAPPETPDEMMAITIAMLLDQLKIRLPYENAQ